VVVATAEEPLQVAESAPQSVAPSVGGYQDGSGRAARIPPSLVTGNRRPVIGDEEETEEESHNDPDPINEPSDPIDRVENDYDPDDPSSQRTVEEMMATASVKRVEASEAPIEKDENGGKSKIGRMVKNIARAMANYKLPSTEMLTPPAPRSEMAETELMERARQLAEKCAEFNVSGQVKQISPGPVREIQPHHQPRRRSVSGLAGRIRSHRPHSRQIHGRHRSPERPS
jgi:DNA segregation ATPase FtsK/SpoIIIE-like protein